MVLGWRIRAAIYRFGQALAAHKKGLPVSPFFYPSISRFMPSAFELSDLIAKALAPKPKAKSCPAGGICYHFVLKSPSIFKPAEIQHVQTGGHSTVTMTEKFSRNFWFLATDGHFGVDVRFGVWVVGGYSGLVKPPYV